MASATLSTKGQIVIPKEFRESHGLVAGTKFEVEFTRGALVLRPVGAPRQTTLGEIAGCLKFSGPAKTLEEMEAGIAEGARASK